jgi:hypothetical protein
MENGIPASASRLSRIEQAVEQRQDQREADRHDQRQALLGQLQLFELAGPLDPVAVRQFHVAGDPLLRLGDGPAEIAAPHAEFDGNETLVAFMEYVGGPGVERDVGKFAQRNIAVAAGRGDVTDLDVAHRLEAVAIFRCEADRHGELAIGLEQRRRRGAAERRLHHRIDVAGIEPVTGGRRPVDLDVEIGLTEHAEDAEIGHARDLIHFPQHVAGEVFERRQIRADDLDRVGAFDPRETFLDVVLNVL